MQCTIISFACFFIWAVAAAQQYPFVHYTPKDGLINSRVKKAYQDSKGRMYFLTLGGLSVYDGVRFKNYTVQDGLPVNIINDVLEVEEDSLLVATNGPALNALVKGKMTLVKTEGKSCPLINQFYRYDQNKVYLACDNGLFILENKNIRQLDVSYLTKNNPDQPYLGNITCTGNYLVLSTHELRGRKGLYLYDIKNNRICDALPEPTVYLFGKDSSNNIWIAMSDKLFILDTAALTNGKLLLISPLHAYEQVRNYPIVNVAFDKGSIWLVYRNKEYRNTEIRRIEENGSLVRIPLPPQTTSSDIKNIIIDRENTVWLCSDGEGVFKIVSSPLRIFQNPLGEKTQNQINKAYHNNNITWYRTTSNSLFRKSGKSLRDFRTNLKESPFVFYENDRNLLASDLTNIYEADLPAQKSIYFRKIISLPPSEFFPSEVKVDHNGAIIAVQSSGLAVWKNNKRIFYSPLFKNDVIEQLAFDKSDFLWVAKRYTGVDIFSLHPENFSHYLQLVCQFNPSQITGSPRCLVIDKSGLIWIGTRDHGLTAYKHEGKRLNKLYHFDAANGLTDNFVTTVACDSFNNIIVGTQTGLDRLIFNAQSSYRVENLSKSSNFFTLIFQSWADAKQAYALTYAGIILQVSPPVLSKKNNAPRLLLEEMRVNAQTVSAEKKNFSHKENNISFLVAAPSFIDEKQVSYSYLLDGSGNKQWSDTIPANSVINLTNLSAGNYLLKVKAFFPSTPYTPADLFYSFEIAPPWWQTVLFRLIAASLAFALLIIATRFYYRRKLEQQRLVLEKQQAIEKERTRIASDMHDDLGAGLSRIKFLSQSISNRKIEDDAIKSELEKITFYSDEMTEKMGEIVWALSEKNDTLADLVAYCRSYAIEYLGNHNIICDAHTPMGLPGNFIAGEIRRNIFLSVKECLHNIVKHAGASRVEFSVELGNRMQITIHDNGKGIDWNNQRAFSNGIQNIQQRMKDINGEVKFYNEQGTKVVLAIPINL